MTPKKLALLTCAGMFLTSVSVYSLTPRPGSGSSGSEAVAIDEAIQAPQVGAKVDTSSFTAGKTLTVEGRMGHAKLLKSSSGEDFVMVEVRGSETAKAKTAAQASLAIVIDRSGSMRGSRMEHAKSAASIAVSRLSEGDTVSVVAFDTGVQVVVPPTPMSAGVRESVINAIQGIRLGGDTCISCGLEQGMAELDQSPPGVKRMILLSDGDTNAGVRDIPGFRSIAQRALTRGASITTIGVDVDFNEKIMAAVAEESNGRHYFVENDSALPRVFETETESLNGTIASDVEVTIDLAPGVELDRVFDRTFRRSGSQVTVPLGTFASKDVKTVLLKVHTSTQRTGEVAMANVSLRFKDLVDGGDGSVTGKLATTVTDSASDADGLDPVVQGRVERSETASTLKAANDLFGQGKTVEARKRLDDQTRTLRAAAEVARRSAPKAKAADVQRDFEGQIAALDNANNGFATPPAQAQQPQAIPFGNAAPVAAAPPAPSPVNHAGKAATKNNAQKASEFGL